jgi:phospholipid transport system substrate-binding protein
MSMSVALIALAALSAPAASSVSAPAAAADPAVVRIEAFDAVLLDTMKHGKSLGLDGRTAKLHPAVVQLFDVPMMAQFAAGPHWRTMTPAEQKSVIEALTRYTVRTYARNFDTYGGEVFRVDPHPAVHGPDKLVKSTVASPSSAPVNLGYRMRERDGQWKVIDVYYNAVSQVTAERADFASTLSSGGAAALVQKLDSQTKTVR